jgi:alpha-tubulin suppressor-like RCC1 family protein
LGDNTTQSDRNTPTPVLGLSAGMRSISAGSYHTCAVDSGNGARCWGQNTKGQLGNNNTTDQRTQVSVNNLSSGVTSISAGNALTCAVHNGAAKCWGTNTSGQVGDGSNQDRSLATPVSGLASGVSAITAGSNGACAMMANGAAKCWGGLMSSNVPVDVKP